MKSEGRSKSADNQILDPTPSRNTHENCSQQEHEATTCVPSNIKASKLPYITSVALDSIQPHLHSHVPPTAHGQY